MGDPNPRVNGEGLARLRAAGIAVTAGVCLDEALALNVGFVARMSRGTPWLWAKMAASLDGRSALPNGRSQWITGEAARADGHHWRARSCAVLTGIGTVLADDPRLDVRHVPSPRPPRKIVLDSQLRMPADARLLDGTQTWIFTAREDAARAAALAARNARVVCLPGEDGRVDLAGVMRWLGEHDINEVHAEAGAVLTGALLQAGCVDELLAYMAPVLLGEGAGMARLPPIEDLDRARRFEFVDAQCVGGDVRLRAQDAARRAALRRAVAARF